MLRSVGLSFGFVLLLLGPTIADEPTGSALKVLKTLLADIGAESDDAFKACKERVKLTPAAIAPKGLRTLLERPGISVGEMRADIVCREGLVTVGWRLEAPVDESIDEAEKMILDELKAGGLEPNAEIPKSREFERIVRMVQGMSQRFTTLSRRTGTGQEFIALGLADRNARPGSKVRVMLQWTASVPFEGPPLTVQEALDILPMLKNAPIEPELLKVASVAVLGLFETGLHDRQARTEPPGLSLFAGDGWGLTTSTDIRPEFEKAIETAGYSLRPTRPRGGGSFEMKSWQHETRKNTVSSVSASSRADGHLMLNFTGTPPRVTTDRPLGRTGPGRGDAN